MVRDVIRLRSFAHWAAFLVLLVLKSSAIGQLKEMEPTVEENQTGYLSAAQTIYPDIPQFGGPNSVSGLLREDNPRDARFRFEDANQYYLREYYEIKERLNSHLGLQFGVNYSTLYQVASQSMSEDDAGGGFFQFLGQWELLNRGSGNAGLLVFESVSRHRLGTSITPLDLGFEAGSILPTGLQYNEFTFSQTQLYWKQYFLNRDGGVGIGRIDISNFVDVYALASPQLHFTNFAFSSNPTIALPDQGLGATGGVLLKDRVYVLAGISDANGKVTRSGFDTFFGDSEYFSFFEIGVTPSKDRLYFDNIHLTYWHVDARKKAGSPESWGLTFSASRFIDNQWLPFLRAGHSEGGAPLLQNMVSAGIGRVFRNRDLTAVGVSWGNPSDNTLSNQITCEAFYRIQLSRTLAITLDVQLILNPALDPTREALAVFGIRLRASF